MNIKFFSFFKSFRFGRKRNEENNSQYRAIRAEEEAALNATDVIETENANMNNVFVTDLLKAYPVALKNHNKVVLPQSLLKELHEKKIWDNRERDKPLIFELVVADPDTSDVLEETHVGVDTFTAPAGKIGIPYKTAMCLTKGRGVGWLHENPLVSIRLVNIKATQQSSMKVQPRGRGFFLEDESVVQLDIRTVLELTMTDHLVLTAGDWIPLFWDGNRFELVVKELEPGEVIDVLNTDLTVEMLPSEETEQSEKEKEEAERRVNGFMEYREKRNDELFDRYAGFKQEEKKAPNSVAIRVRLPKGGQLTKTLKNSDPLATLVDLIDLELYRKKFVPMHLPPEGLNFFFNLVHALPGKGKTTIDTNACAMTPIIEVLKEHELPEKMIVFSLAMIKEVDEEEGAGEDGRAITTLNNDWIRMADRLEACLQETEEEVDLLPQEEIDEITEKLTGVGTDPELAKKVARLYGKQVNQIINMGYGETLPRAAQLLNEKRGNLQEVINSLLMS